MKPIELYRFVQDTEVWTYTSSASAIVYNSETYIPVPIGRGNVEAKNELSKANLEIQTDLDNPLSRQLMTTSGELVVGLTVFVQVDTDFTVLWKGRLASIKPEGNKITLTFESIFTSLRRPGLRARYQRNCRHAVYNRGCNLDPEDFALQGWVILAQGNLVQVVEASSQPDGWYLGGMLRAPDGILRMITGHTGQMLTLSRPLESLLQNMVNSGYGYNYGYNYGGVAVKLYPGCDRLKSTCITKFNNLPNFGGFPYIPTKNPFGGSSIV